MKSTVAWWFSDETHKLSHDDGRPVVIGEEHTVKGRPVLCKHGLHASERILDALEYAPSPIVYIVYLVKLSGRIKRGRDKIVATRRKYMAGGIDIFEVLLKFARLLALEKACYWRMPEIIRQYLETGDESIREEAKKAAEHHLRTFDGTNTTAAYWAIRAADIACAPCYYITELIANTVETVIASAFWALLDQNYHLPLSWGKHYTVARTIINKRLEDMVLAEINKGGS